MSVPPRPCSLSGEEDDLPPRPPCPKGGGNATAALTGPPAPGEPGVVVAVDPGTEKCGLAVVACDGGVRSLQIVPTDRIALAVVEVTQSSPAVAILVGDRTASKAVIGQLASHGLSPPAQLASEHETTLRARERYFRDHPPRGWRRLVPRGMLVPPRPVDDYAALVMAEEWLRRQPTH